MMEVEGPDGTIYEFPEGTSPDVMRAAMQKVYGTPEEAEAVPSAVDATAARNSQVQEMRSAAETPPANNWSDLINPIFGLADQTARGIATGVTNIVGLPGAMHDVYSNVIDTGLEAAGAPEFVRDAVGGVRAVTGGWLPQPSELQGALDTANDATADTLGLERPRREPQNVAEMYGNRIGEEVGAIAIPGAAAMGTASRIGVEGARRLPPLLRSLVEPAAVNPGRYIGREVSAATGAGAGAATATGLTGADRDSLKGAMIDAGGAVSGAGVVGLGSAFLRNGADLATAVFAPHRYNSRETQQDVADQIIRAAGLTPDQNNVVDAGPLIGQIEQGRRVDDVIPGFQESLADRTQNPGLAALEYGRQSGPNSGTYAGRRAENTRAVDAAMDRSEPQGNPGAFRQGLEAQRDVRIGEASAQAETAAANFDQATQSLRATMTADARGADIRAALEGASDEAKELVRRAWEPLNRSGAEVDVAPLADRYGQINESLSVAERNRFLPAEARIPEQLTTPAVPDTGPTPSSILDASGNPVMRPGQPGTPASGMQPINEVTGLRSALTDAAREASTAGRTNEARIINNHIDALDEVLEASVPADLRQSYDTARAARRDFADRFERPQTAIAQTLDRQQGQYRAPDSSVAGRFVQTDEGNIANFQSLMREAGSDDRVRGAVRDQMLADVRDRNLLDDPQALDEYVGRYKTVLDQFPDLRSELGNASGLRRTLGEAQANEADLRRMLGDDTRAGRSAVGKYLRFGDENADRAMRGVMSAAEPGKAMDELLTFVGDDPEAVEGARKVFWDIMQKTGRRGGETTQEIGAGQPWMPRALIRFLDDPRNAAVAERLYRDNPEQLSNVRQIAEALQGVDLRNSARAPNTSGTAQGMSEVLSPATLQSRYYAMQTGRTSMSFMVTSIATVALRRMTAKAREAATSKMLDDALLNPDAAAVLLKENNPANREALSKYAKLWFGNEAGAIMNAVSGEQEDDEETRAIMRGQ